LLLFVHKKKTSFFHGPSAALDKRRPVWLMIVMPHTYSGAATTIRAATTADAATIADIDRAARDAALPSVRWAHTPDQVRGWIEAVLLPRGGVWLAEREGAALGYMALHADWVEQLYIRPEHWRQGVGSALLGHAKRHRPAGLRLWCFQVNAAARAFYEAQGFAVLVHTDGAGNEEREPDMLYAWPPTAWQHLPAAAGAAPPAAP
jgi:GNAT superfamily N-acetyltransferase